MEILADLHNAALDVACVGCFTGRVNEPLAAGHGVEEELRWREALEVVVPNVPLALCAVVVAHKARQRSPAETELNSLSLAVLLPDNPADLRDVHVVSLGTSLDHALEPVVVRVALDDLETGLAAALTEHLVDFLLKLFLQCAPAAVAEAVLHRREAEVADFAISLFENALDFECAVGLWHRIPDSHGKPVLNEVVRGERLDAVHKGLAGVTAVHVGDDVNKRIGDVPNNAFDHSAVNELTITDEHTTVSRCHAGALRRWVRPVAVILLGHVLVLEGNRKAIQRHGERLLASPQRRRLQNSRHFEQLSRGDVCGVALEVHHAQDVVLHFHPVDEGIAPREEVDSRERILVDAHHRVAAARVDKVLLDHHELHELSLREHALRDVQIHFVAVKVRVVWSRRREVHAEGVVWQNAHTVPHHGHSVQRRLSVEKHHVAVQQVALNNCPWDEVDSASVANILQADAVTVRLDDVIRPRMDVRAPSDEVCQLIVVEGCHTLGEGECHRHTPRNADLVDLHV